MPPFGPKQFESKLSPEERRLAKRRSELENGLYNRVLEALRKKNLKHYERKFLDGAATDTAEYRAKGQHGSNHTHATAEAHLGSTDAPFVSIKTRGVRIRADGSRTPTTLPVTQLTLRPTVRKEGSFEATLVDNNNPFRTWTDRQAIETLEIGVDTMDLIEAAQASKDTTAGVGSVALHEMAVVSWPNA